MEYCFGQAFDAWAYARKGQELDAASRIQKKMIEHATLELADNLEKPDWPADGREDVQACPVCGSKRRRQLYTGLRDRVFFSAPGEWTLHECLACHSAYLDPRPTIETIHLAYRTYITHQKISRPSYEALHGLKALRRVLANGYVNWRFGSTLQPAIAFGVLVAFLLPNKRAVLDRAFRHLPAVASGRRLLDIGFGAGSFLECAQSAGWEAVGIDPDRIVVENARQRGLDVYHGSLEIFDDTAEQFDVITISHVIEHVHNPRATLIRINRLLKPGGMFWLETPNIESLGHDRFRRHALHLDPPRHLAIFNWSSLLTLLRETGFVNIRPRICYDTYYSLAAASRSIKAGADPFSDRRVSFKYWSEGFLAGLIARLLPRKSEFITLTAYKAMQESLK